MSVFSRLDADNDGKISKEEVLKHHASGDTDGDGSISREEFVKRMMKARFSHGRSGWGKGSTSDRKEGDKKSDSGSGSRRFGHGGPPSPGAMFAHVDKNKDGKVTKDEVPEFVWSRMSKSDTNGDGSVSKEEFEARMKQVFEEHRKKLQEQSKSKPDDKAKKDEPAKKDDKAKKDEKKTSVEAEQQDTVTEATVPEGDSLSAHP
jgi:Ca2+-binding EF-hand superfamily protein